MNANWSTDEPTEVGYYWAYESLDPEDADVMLVHLDKKGRVYSVGDEIGWNASNFSHWIGPLEIPAPPKE